MYLLSHLQKQVFCDLGALALILSASPRTRFRGIEGGFHGVPAKTALNNPLAGTPDHANNAFLQMAKGLPPAIGKKLSL